MEECFIAMSRKYFSAALLSYSAEPSALPLHERNTFIVMSHFFQVVHSVCGGGGVRSGELRGGKKGRKKKTLMRSLTKRRRRTHAEKVRRA